MRANDSKSSGAGSVLLGIAAIALAGMVGTIGLIREVGEFGPKVGDIVAFDPLDPISRDMKARLPAMSADDRPGVACVLDVRAMHAGGGSVIVEGREPGTDFGYRVHWAGARSATMAPIAARPPNCASIARMSRSWPWPPAAMASRPASRSARSGGSPPRRKRRPPEMAGRLTAAPVSAT